MKWLPTKDCLPYLKDKNYPYSEDVLVTDGKEIFIAQLHISTDNDYEPYFVHPEINLKNISHWMPLPDLP